MGDTVPPLPRYSQGDIFSDVPWTVVRDLDWVTPLSAQEGTRRRFQEDVTPQVGAKARLVAFAGRAPGLVITHSCVLDKPATQHVCFARVVPLTSQKREEGRDRIRTGRNREAFYLADVPGLGGEWYADLRLLTTIEGQHLPGLTRLASLTFEARQALQARLILYWTRRVPPDAFPPLENDLEEDFPF